MKSNLLILAGAIILTACNHQPTTFTLTGTLSGIDSDTILVRSWSVQQGVDDIRLQTLALGDDGSFAYQTTDSAMRILSVFEKPVSMPDEHGQPKTMPLRRLTFPLIPGGTLRLSGQLPDAHITGDTFYEELGNVFKQQYAYQEKIDSIMEQCARMQQQGADQDDIATVAASVQTWMERTQEFNLDYVRTHPDNDVSLFLLWQTDISIAGPYLDSLTSNVTKGILAPIYTDLTRRYAQAQAYAKAKEAVSEGNTAPDFTLSDLAGNPFTLSSLRGKYVVLDFWGSWCGWCIKGIPDMKKMYERYKSRLEVVGIACRDTDEKWRKAVDQYQLPWVNVINSDSLDVAALYAVTGYPTKYIIDPEGKILRCVIGESAEFYEAIDQLIRP